MQSLDLAEVTLEVTALCAKGPRGGGGAQKDVSRGGTQSHSHTITTHGCSHLPAVHLRTGADVPLERCALSVTTSECWRECICQDEVRLA